MVLVGSLPHAKSATTTRTLATKVVVAGTGVDVLFDPIDSVSDLIEISEGSVSTGEGGSYVISAILDNDSIMQLFSGTLPHSGTVNFNTFTGNSFTDLLPPETIKGLRFSTTGPITNPQLILPIGTKFTFTVPETSAALLTMMGLTFLGIRRSRTRV